MNRRFSRVRRCLDIYKVPDFKCDLSVLNTKERFYYPIVNIIHCGFFPTSPVTAIFWYYQLEGVSLSSMYPLFLA